MFIHLESTRACDNCKAQEGEREPNVGSNLTTSKMEWAWDGFDKFWHDPGKRSQIMSLPPSRLIANPVLWLDAPDGPSACLTCWPELECSAIVAISDAQ